MKEYRPRTGLGKLCSMYGVTRQSYYEALSRSRHTEMAYEVLATLIGEVKADIPGLGGVKMYRVLQPALEAHHIKMGRDKFLSFWSDYGFKVRRGRRRQIKTTDSFHRFHKYRDLTKGLEITGPEQLWVSDLTYIRTGGDFSYLTLIMDAYSRKVMGYALHETMETAGCLKALRMALRQRRHPDRYGLIHHSDRGIQYCSVAYVDTLLRAGIQISMTESGSPYENAKAERINETVKLDYFPGRMYSSYAEASMEIDRIIQSYNERRPHQSLDYLTPEEAHAKEGPIPRRWKVNKRKYHNPEPAEPDAE